MIIILTLKACLKELTIMVLYLVIAMFLFATTISFVELQSDTGVGIPDCIYGNWLLYFIQLQHTSYRQ